MRRLVSAEFLKDPQNEGQYGLKYGAGNTFISELCITNNGVIQVGMQAIRKELPPFDRGHFEFEYKVLETTNWNGVVFPLRSIFRKYVPTPGATNRDNVLVAVITQFQVKSFRDGIGRPLIDPPKLIVYDNRLSNEPGREPVKYLVSNGQWLAPTNPAGHSLR